MDETLMNVLVKVTNNVKKQLLFEGFLLQMDWVMSVVVIAFLE